MSAMFENGADGRADELRTLLALHGMAMRAMAHGLCMFDADLRVVLFNRRYLEILDLPPGAVRPGVSFRAVCERNSHAEGLSGAARAEMWREREDLLARGQSFSLHRRAAKDAAIAFHFRPVAGGGWVATCDELAERHTERELRTQVGRLNRVVEKVSHGICLFDAEQRLVTCNDRYLQTCGVNREAVQPGRAFRDILNRVIEAGIYPDLGL